MKDGHNIIDVNVLENIIDVNEEIGSNRILLIFDGLDEYGDRRLSFGSKLGLAKNVCKTSWPLIEEAIN